MDNIIFNTVNGELVGGVSIQNQVKTDQQTFMGGSVENAPGFGLARFNNLVVPAGLFMSMHGGGKKNVKREENLDAECVSDELYEKLFGMVRYDMPVLEKRRKTKKNIVVKNKSKKQTK